MIEPLGLGLLSLVEGGSAPPGVALCAGFLSVALLALELILPFA